MNPYLRRVVGRFSGRPPRALQPGASRRWSSAAADPFAADEAAESEATARPTATTSSAGVAGLGPAGFEGPTPSATAAGPGPARTARARAASRTDSAESSEDSGDAPRLPRPRVLRAFDRSVIPDHHAAIRPVRISSFSDTPVGPDASEPARVESGPASRKTGSEESPDLLRPQARPRGREQDSGREPGERPSAVTPPPVLTPPREPASRPAPDGPPRSGPATDREVSRARIVLTPAPARATEPPPPRAEVVIGRISVVIESARLAPPPPRPAPRSVSGPTRPADGDAEIAHRFGLGQL